MIIARISIVFLFAISLPQMLEAIWQIYISEYRHDSLKLFLYFFIQSSPCLFAAALLGSDRLLRLMIRDADSFVLRIDPAGLFFSGLLIIGFYYSASFLYKTSFLVSLLLSGEMINDLLISEIIVSLLISFLFIFYARPLSEFVGKWISRK